FTPGSISKLNQFIDKVTTDAKYAEDLSRSETLRNRVKKKSKTKDESIPRNYKSLAKNFAKIKPEDVDNFEEYQAVAGEILAGFADPKTPVYKPVNESRVRNYINKASEASTQRDIQRVRDEFGFGDEFTDEEIGQLINSENLDEEPFYLNKEDTKKKIARDKILKTAEFSKIGLDAVENP